MQKRILSLDVLRGIAVLQMIFWQIFDFFSRTNIYAYESPYFINIFNMPINGPGLALFGVVSGASLYISISRKLEKGMKKQSILAHSIKRYGGYILLSLFFTSFVFGFPTFYKWNEAIQGIGLAALVIAVLLLAIDSKWFFAALGLITMFIQPVLRKMINSSTLAKSFPVEPVFFKPVNNIISLLLNATLRGFFSLAHALPILLIGVVLAYFIKEMQRQQLIRTTLITGSFIVIISAFLHMYFQRIDIYNISSTYLFSFIGFTFLIFGLIEYTLIRNRNNIIRFLSLFGKTALAAYLLHFLLIYKVLLILRIESTFSQIISYILTIISIGVIYYICKFWLENKKRILSIIRLSDSRSRN